MARMHRRKKGKASSKHPIERKHPSWGLDVKEIEESWKKANKNFGGA